MKNDHKPDISKRFKPGPEKNKQINAYLDQRIYITQNGTICALRYAILEKYTKAINNISKLTKNFCGQFHLIIHIEYTKATTNKK